MLQEYRRPSDGNFVRQVLFVVAIVAIAAALYKLSDVVLLGFGAVIVAVVLRAIARPIEAATPLDQRLSLLVAVITITALIGLAGYLFGAKIFEQLSLLSKALPDAAHQLSKNVPISDLAGSSFGTLAMSILSWGTTLFGAAAFRALAESLRAAFEGEVIEHFRQARADAKGCNAA